MQGFKKFHSKLLEKLIIQTLYDKVWWTDGQKDGWTDRQGQILMPPDYHQRCIIMPLTIITAAKKKEQNKTKLIHTSRSSKACWVGYIRIHGDWTIASESSTGATSANYRCSWWTITSKSFPIWGYRNWWQGSIGTRDTGWLLAAGILGVILHVAFSGKILERWASG